MSKKNINFAENFATMRFILTHFAPTDTLVNVNDCRVYRTTCEDSHFIEIIESNKEILEGEFIHTNTLFVLMDNEYVESARNFYASISLHTKRKDDAISYYPCVVTCEELMCWNVYLKYLLERVINHLSDDKSYFSFDKEHYENTKIQGNEETIVTQLLQKCGVEM